MWRVTASAHFWDRHSNDVEDSTAVYFFIDPPDNGSIDGFGLTGYDADDVEHIRGVALDYMMYDCYATGLPIDTLWACSAGEVAEYNNPFDPNEITGWHSGNVCVNVTDILWPFQPGDRDDNLTLEVSSDQVVFLPCDDPECQDVLVRATLRDGYGCLVSNQLIQFWSSNGGEFDPAEGITDINGQVETTLTVCPDVLDNTGVPCPEPNDDCFRWNPYNLSFGAIRQPGGPSSDVMIIQLSRPCQ